MNTIERFFSFWYRFIVGDDWRIALGVIIGLAITAYLTHVAKIQAWWLLPVLVVTALSLSLWRASRE